MLCWPQVTDISELREIIYNEIMTKCREQKTPILEVEHTSNDNSAESSVSHSVRESISSLSNQVVISDTRTSINISKCTSSNVLAFNKPIVTVTHQLSDGKVVVSFAANKLHAEKALKPVARMVADACNNRSSVRSARSRAKSRVVSHYQSILPSAVREVASTDTKVVASSGQTLDAKAILRAAILSGRRKEPGYFIGLSIVSMFE